MKRFRLRERRHLASTMQDQGRGIIDAIVIVVGLLIAFWLIQDLDLFQKLVNFTGETKTTQLDEIIVVVLLGSFGGFVFGVRRLQDQRREIKRRQQAEDRAQQLALADALTGLPNRRQFGSRLSAALVQPRRKRPSRRPDDDRPRPLQTGQRRLRPRHRRPGADSVRQACLRGCRFGSHARAFRR